MRLYTIKSTVAVTAGLSAMLGVVVLLGAPVGCKKAADDPAAGSSASSASSSSDSSSDGGGGTGDDVDGGESGGEEDGPIDASVFPQLKQMMTEQASLPAIQADTLRQVLAEHPDDPLRAIIAELDAKNASIKAMLEKITSPADSKALQVDVPKAIGEAGELVGKANARIIEVLRPRVGGGG